MHLHGVPKFGLFTRCQCNIRSASSPGHRPECHILIVWQSPLNIITSLLCLHGLRYRETVRNMETFTISSSSTFDHPTLNLESCKICERSTVDEHPLVTYRRWLNKHGAIRQQPYSIQMIYRALRAVLDPKSDNDSYIMMDRCTRPSLSSTTIDEHISNAY